MSLFFCSSGGLNSFFRSAVPFWAQTFEYFNFGDSVRKGDMTLTLLEPQSRSGDKPVKFQVVLSPNGTAVLKGLMNPLGELS